ncbi:uncharacterized protein LOC119377081 [Rhipicephalus sanguineus]|uniref:uncharacterized protein LOC119377081 n=1 Tax=Rhipicephalus sanguineus TaxID=34632 RepID=UPI0018935A67|nr:uncharacterized protein LOC119377081 [Rhipicephalus sanguineus]
MDRLRRTRGVIRAAATKLITSATEALQAENPSPTDLQVILDDLQDKDTTLADLNQKIADITTDGAEYEEEVTMALDYHDKIRNTMSRVRYLLQSAARPADGAAPGVATETRPQEVSAQASNRSQLRVALPKLQVPVFSGELREWQGFWEHFEATIHNNCELSDIEKFSYLRSYVTGAAKRAIEGVRLEQANYAVAVKVLKERFGRHTALVDEHIDSLLAIATVDHSSNLSQLRELYEEVRFHTSCLDSLGVQASEYAVILHRVLMRALPEDIAILYRQRMKETEANDGATPRSRQEEVRDVMKFLQIQIESREESSRSRSLRKSSLVAQEQRHPRLQPPVPSAVALAAGSANNSHACCVLCGHRDHIVKDCQTIMSADEIRRRLIEKNCCFRCAREGHVARKCRNAAWLKCKHCANHHLTALCAIWKPYNHPNADRSDTTKTDSVPVTTSAPASSSTSPSPAVLMQTATVWVSGRHNSVLVRILLDTGSQRTFIRRDLSTRLDLPSVGTEDLSLLTFGSSKHSRTYRYRTVQLKLQSRFDTHGITVDALEVPEVCIVRTPAIGQDLLVQLRERNMLVADEQQLGDRPTQTISVIIGSDHYWRIVTGRIERLSSDLCAVETIFGWLVQGIYQVETAKELHHGNYSTSALFLACERHSQATPCMVDPTEMWRLDAIGITDPSEDVGTLDQASLNLFTQCMHKEAGRYVVPLMIKHQGRLTSTNRSVAETRLKRQLQRFEGQRALLEEYDRTIREYFTEGHAERVDTSSEPGATVYYLPHHAVVRRDAITTKIRVVFDASSHERGESSLNDILDKGVKLGAELLQLLVQFRMNPIILTADIRKAFLQISIRQEDRDALRFLWVNRITDEEGKPPRIVEWRMTRVPFGASSSPFLLAATLQHHFDMWKKTEPVLATRLQKAFYVDDLVIGASTDEEALELYRAALNI